MVAWLSAHCAREVVYGPQGARSSSLSLGRTCGGYRPASRDEPLVAGSNLKTAATDFKEAIKGTAGPEHERSECEGDLSLLCALSTALGSRQRCAGPLLPNAVRCSPCCQRDRGVDFCRQVSLWRGCTGPLGPEGVCWSRVAYRVQRGKGRLGVGALAYVPVTVHRRPKASAGPSLMR